MSNQAQFPKKLKFLFSPSRYKIAHGGRGSGKSWGFARALLIQAAQTPLRVLCCREIQKSLKDSVHTLLSDQIQALGLASFYTVTENQIKGANGSSFIFAGLADHTTDSIKSYEGVDRCWIEEGHSISRRSMDILFPTIRKAGSEIWVSMNPELDSDPMYLEFCVDPPPDAVVVQVNYYDNPWFSPELESQRARREATDPVGYRHIWLGEPRSTVEGAIYAEEVAAMVAEKRICRVPHDPMLQAHVVFDLGWNDSMSICIVQRSGSELRFIDYLEDSHKTLEWFSTELRTKGYNWGTVYLPHDGLQKDYKTGKSAAQIMEALGWTVSAIPVGSVEGGIKAARMMFPRCIMDTERTARLQECLRRYRRRINQLTNEPGAPEHDEYSHGADSFRYVAAVADYLPSSGRATVSAEPELDLAAGWMG